MYTRRRINFNINEWEKSEQYIEVGKMAKILSYSKKTLMGIIYKDKQNDKYVKRVIDGEESMVIIDKDIIFSLWLVKEYEASSYFKIPIESIEKLSKEGAIEKLIINNFGTRIVAYSRKVTEIFRQKYVIAGNKGMKPSTYFTVEEAYEKYQENYSFDEFMNYAFENFVIQCKFGMWFIRKTSIYNQFYYSLKETKERLKIVYENIILQMIEEGYIQEPLKEGGSSKGGGSVYFLKKDIDDKSYNDFKIFMAKKGRADANVKLKLKNYKDKYEIIEAKLSIVQETPYQETLKLLKDYINNYANSSKKFREKSFYSYLSAIAVNIMKNINKEIKEYNDAEVKFLIMNTSIFPKYNADHAALMIEYIKDKSDHCKYSVVPRPYREKSAIQDDEKTFSPELIEKYFYYLADLDRHFEKAFNNHKYANLWCIALFHFSNAWRLVDIYQIPNIQIECIGINTFESLINKGLSIGQATILMTHVQELARDLVSSKNSGNIPLVRDLDLMIQTAVAFILCELHRRESGDDKLFQRYINSNPSNVDWKWFFENDELKNFGSLKANRSFMTGIFEYANGKEGFKRLAYAIIVKFRGHLIKENIDDTDTTRIYLEIIKHNGHVDDIAYECLRRGRFGFINYLILKAADFDVTNVTREEVSDQIEILKNNTTISSIENFSDFLLYQNKIYNELLQEMLSFKISSNNQFKTIILKILRGEQPAKLSNSDCFVGIRNCSYKESEDRYCAICKYNIPTMWVLIKVKEDVYQLIDKIYKEYTGDKFILEKYKILLKKYSIVIVTAYNEFKKYDKEFIYSFIDIEKFEKDVRKVSERLKLLEES